MKNFNFLRFVAAFSLFAILFSSCTKDSLSKPQNSGQISQQNSTNDPGPVVTTGSIQANLYSSTALRTSLKAINDDTGFTSEEIFADQDGNVIINELPEGRYTVIAYAYLPDDNPTSPVDVTVITITITDVMVVVDQITDLGRITFE